MLQNVRVTGFIVSELLREKPTGSKITRRQNLWNPGNSESLHSDISRIFKIMACFKSDRYSEPSQRLKMECFAKIVKSYNYCSKALYLQSLAGFPMR